MGSSILGSGRSNMFGGSDRFPAVSSSSIARRCEEEAVAWAAIERLSTCERLRTSILNDLLNNHNHSIASGHQQIDVTNIPSEARKQLIERLLGVSEEDNQRFLLKLRHRLDRVGIILPDIEIRFHDLNISADVYVGSRALPTLFNWTVNMVEVISRKDQEQYWCRTQAYHYVSVKDFAEAFQSFHVGINLNSELSVPYYKSKNHPAALSTEKYGLSKSELFKSCFDREVLLMKRNAFIYIFKFLQITVVATLAMTIFFRTNMHHKTLDDAGIYFGVLFLGLVMNMFNGMAGIDMTIAKLPVFYKQRDFMFYPAWAYSLPIWITELPSSLIESPAWITLTYYTIVFAPSPYRFFRQFLVYVGLHQTGLRLFRFIAALSRSLIIANSVGVYALLLTLVFGGYIISRGIYLWGQVGY